MKEFIKVLKNVRVERVCFWRSICYVITFIIIFHYFFSICITVDQWVGFEDIGYKENCLSYQSLISQGKYGDALRIGAIAPSLYTRSFLVSWYYILFKILGPDAKAHHLVNFFVFVIGIFIFGKLTSELSRSNFTFSLGVLIYSSWFYCVQDTLVLSLAESVLRVNFMLGVLLFFLFLRSIGLKAIVLGIGAMFFIFATVTTKEVGIVILPVCLIPFISFKYHRKGLKKCWPLIPAFLFSIYHIIYAISYIMIFQEKSSFDESSMNIQHLPVYLRLNINNIIHSVGYYFDSGLNNLGLMLSMFFGVMIGLFRNRKSHYIAWVYGITFFLMVVFTFALQLTYVIAANRFASFIFLPILFLVSGHLSRVIECSREKILLWQKEIIIWCVLFVVIIISGMGKWSSGKINITFGIGAGLGLIVLSISYGFRIISSRSRISQVGAIFILLSFLIPNIVRSTNYLRGWRTGYLFRQSLIIKIDDINSTTPIIVEDNLYKHISLFIGSEKIKNIIPQSEVSSQAMYFRKTGYFLNGSVNIRSHGDHFMPAVKENPGDIKRIFKNFFNGFLISSDTTIQSSLICYPDWALVNLISILPCGDKLMENRWDKGTYRSLFSMFSHRAKWRLYKFLVS